MNEARFGPRHIIIQVQRSTFSDPLSPRTLDGHPNSSMLSRNSLSTVFAVLLDDTLIPVICQESTDWWAVEGLII